MPEMGIRRLRPFNKYAILTYGGNMKTEALWLHAVCNRTDVASSTGFVPCDGQRECVRALAFSTSRKNPTADKCQRLCSGLKAHWLCWLSVSKLSAYGNSTKRSSRNQRPKRPKSCILCLAPQHETVVVRLIFQQLYAELWDLVGTSHFFRLCVCKT